MAAFPPISQIVGLHSLVYDTYFTQVEPKDNGIIEASKAAAFIKRSGLPETILSKIWDLSDPMQKGYLDKHGFIVAMKLIALVQNGQEPNIANICLPFPPPNMGVQHGIIGTQAEWSIPLAERMKYDQIFEGLQPVKGLLTGDKVKPVLLNSKLPIDVLGRVWELSDIDADGFLDKEEFTVAMHLVYRALEKNPVPMVLPDDMIPPSKRKDIAIGPLAGSGPILPGTLPAAVVGQMPHMFPPSSASPPLAAPVPLGSSKWVVTPAEKLKYDEMFRHTDTDMDGLVNGLEIKDIFLQTGLPQMTLAHIWNLCDTKVMGKLNCDQFALAMHLVQQKLLHNIDPPQQLTPDMIPPSLQDHTTGLIPVSTDTTGMKELDKLSEEIENLKREKLRLEQDKTQKEADIKISNGEVASLQKELDSINATVMQLSVQKGEAQKRLDELDDKKEKLEQSVRDCREKYDEEQKLIQEFQNQILNSESIASSQEAELKRMRDELNSLRQEESDLEHRVDASRRQADTLTKRISDTQAEISQMRTRLSQLKGLTQPMSDSIKQYDALLSNEITEDQATNLDPLSQEQLDLITSVSSTSHSSNMIISQTGTKYDPFTNKDPFISAAAPDVGIVDPFHNDDPFANKDPFAFSATAKSDPFDADPFAESFAPIPDLATKSSPTFTNYAPSSKTDSFFVGGDPWGAAFPTSTADITLDAFDPFGSATTTASDTTSNTGGDPFGTGSFAPSPHHSSGSSSKKHQTMPALPPKQKKAPAPPRPPAPKPSSEDPTSYRSGDSWTKNDNFSNFPDFQQTKFTSEEEQLAWATRDSQQEWERQKRLRDQEQADLERAIALSKQ